MSESVDDLANARALARDTPSAANKVALAGAAIAHALTILRTKFPVGRLDPGWDAAFDAAGCLLNAQSELVSVLPMLETHAVGSGVVGSPRPASPELSGTPEPAPASGRLPRIGSTWIGNGDLRKRGIAIVVSAGGDGARVEQWVEFRHMVGEPVRWAMWRFCALYKHVDETNHQVRSVAECAPPEPKPVAMILHCPECSERHVDHGDFATKPHHTHSCQACGLTWRPAVVATVGVQHLPNFKDTTGPNADLCPPPGMHPNDGTWWKRGRLIEMNKVLREANARAEHDANTLALQLADVVAERDAALRKLGTPPQLDTAGKVVPGSPDLSKVPDTDVPTAIAQLQQLAKDLEPVAPTVRAKLRDVIRTLGGPT